MIDRRRFLGVAGTALAIGSRPASASIRGANDRLRLGIIGTGSRGTELSQTFGNQENVEIAYVCDVDRKRVDRAADLVSKLDHGTPKSVIDFRRILEDKTVDAVVIATCDHWHAPAAILACSAEKHVYVEKPCSHNAQEGEWLVEAAQKHKRVVQLGTQRRSWPKLIEAVESIHQGAIGRAYYASCRYRNTRKSIGKGKVVPVPEGLDFDLWQGPAPRQEFRDNILHYTWHWFWNWGTGELGNNGIHFLDVCRWALQVDFPTKVASTGGRFAFKDDQETPDTQVVSYEFEGGKAAAFESLSCNGYQVGGPSEEIVIQGESGSISISGGGYTLFDLKGKKVKTVTGSGGDKDHVADFLASIREGRRPHAEILEGHKSTTLCHLGNISQRVGRTLHCDPKNGRILDDGDAAKLWGRTYEKGWEPKV